jgi:hypothetical protein
VLARAVDALLARCGEEIAVAAPLGLGKPHRPLNALYDRVESEASRRLRSHTALSLEPPAPRAGLEQRFLGPFLARHFGADLPRLRYVKAQKSDALPGERARRGVLPAVRRVAVTTATLGPAGHGVARRSSSSSPSKG